MVLSLKFCPHIDGENLKTIANYANPFYLRELYLDGCDRILDSGIEFLVQKRYGQPKFQLFGYEDESYEKGRRKSNLISSTSSTAFVNERINEFHCLALRDEDSHTILSNVAQGGARGLEVISLAECKNITDTGVIQ